MSKTENKARLGCLLSVCNDKFITKVTEWIDRDQCITVGMVADKSDVKTIC